MKQIVSKTSVAGQKWRLSYRFYLDKDGKVGFEQNQMGNIQVLR